MNKKYEFVESDTLTLAGVTLIRIRAVRDIPWHGVKAGDLGGYIEIEENLPHDDSSWVDCHSRVIGKHSTVEDSSVEDSSVEDSMIVDSMIVDSEVQGSTVQGSTVRGRSIEDSIIVDSEVRGSTVRGSTVRGSTVRGGSIEDSSVEDSRVRGSVILCGEIFNDQHHVLFSSVGSEKGRLTAYRAATGVRVTRGCFSGTLEEFESAVNEKHGNNQHGQEYRILIEFIKKRASAWKKEGV